MLMSHALPIATLRMCCLPEEIGEMFDKRALKEWPFVLWAGYLFISLLGLYLPSYFFSALRHPIYGHRPCFLLATSFKR